MTKMTHRRTQLGLTRFPWLPVIIIAGFIFLTIFVPFLSSHDPELVSLRERLKPPSLSSGFLLGTDHLGRDVLTRIFYGGRISFGVAIVALLVGAAIGTVVGMVAGYTRGKVDTVLMRATDATFSIPAIFLALLMAVMLGPSFWTVIIAVATVLWARFARIVRGDTLSLRELDFVVQAKIDGCSSLRIMAVHIFPNLLGTLVVLITLNLGWVIIMEATLSFLGAGIPPNVPSWGGMIAAGRSYISTAWWVSFMPGVAISLTVLAFNLFGDWLRDTMDPRLREV